LEIANRAQDQIVGAISDLDAKAGSLVDFTAVVTGLYLVAGIGIRDLGGASCVAYRNLSFVSLFLGVATGLTAMILAMLSWRKGKLAIFELPAFVRKTELEDADHVRAFAIGQLMHQFAKNVEYYDRQKKWVRGAMTVLGVTVANVGIFIGAAALAVTTVCA